MEMSMIEKMEEQTDFVSDAIDLNSKKQPIVGRVWMNENSVSGYVVIAPGVCLKFAGNTERNPCFLYLSKK